MPVERDKPGVGELRRGAQFAGAERGRRPSEPARYASIASKPSASGSGLAKRARSMRKPGSAATPPEYWNGCVMKRYPPAAKGRHRASWCPPVALSAGTTTPCGGFSVEPAGGRSVVRYRPGVDRVAYTVRDKHRARPISVSLEEVRSISVQIDRRKGQGFEATASRVRPSLRPKAAPPRVLDADAVAAGLVIPGFVRDDHTGQQWLGVRALSRCAVAPHAHEIAPTP